VRRSARLTEERPPDLRRHAELVDAVLRAEETVEAFAHFLAVWQAAGSPRDRAHSASDDLVAAHDEARYVRERIEKYVERYGTKLADEIETARRHPHEGKLVGVVLTRLARVRRRRVELPNRLQAPKALRTDSTAVRRRRRRSDRSRGELVSEARTSAQNVLAA
jgi:hypothetical protein